LQRPQHQHVEGALEEFDAVLVGRAGHGRRQSTT
jgi:hypothetical protein